MSSNFCSHCPRSILYFHTQTPRRRLPLFLFDLESSFLSWRKDDPTLWRSISPDNKVGLYEEERRGLEDRHGISHDVLCRSSLQVGLHHHRQRTPICCSYLLNNQLSPSTLFFASLCWAKSLPKIDKCLFKIVNSDPRRDHLHFYYKSSSSTHVVEVLGSIDSEIISSK